MVKLYKTMCMANTILMALTKFFFFYPFFCATLSTNKQDINNIVLISFLAPWLSLTFLIYLLILLSQGMKLQPLLLHILFLTFIISSFVFVVLPLHALHHSSHLLVSCKLQVYLVLLLTPIYADLVQDNNPYLYYNHKHLLD